jgi:hypothetical protein
MCPLLYIRSDLNFPNYEKRKDVKDCSAQPNIVQVVHYCRGQRRCRRDAAKKRLPSCTNSMASDVAQTGQIANARARGFFMNLIPEKVSDDTSLGFFQGTVRAMLLVKIKTILKTAAMKSFNPGKVSMFQELKVSRY